MKILLKSNDHVYISWIKSLLNSNGINYFILDEEMSVMEGSITAIPIRILVDSKDIVKAKQIIENEKKNIKSTKRN